MTSQNSVQEDIIRPEDLMEELNIKKDTYYGDLSYLEIRANKDSEGKAYLTKEQAEQVRALRSHVGRTGKREGFESRAIVRASERQLSENRGKARESGEDIYIEPDDPTEGVDIERLMRSAAELKAREIAMPHLVKREIANRLSEEELPEDLRDKVEAVREAANPKYTPTEVAERLLGKWRSTKRG